MDAETRKRTAVADRTVTAAQGRFRLILLKNTTVQARNPLDMIVHRDLVEQRTLRVLPWSQSDPIIAIHIHQT